MQIYNDSFAALMLMIVLLNCGVLWLAATITKTKPNYGE